RFGRTPQSRVSPLRCPRSVRPSVRPPLAPQRPPTGARGRKEDERRTRRREKSQSPQRVRGAGQGQRRAGEANRAGPERKWIPELLAVGDRSGEADRVAWTWLGPLHWRGPAAGFFALSVHLRRHRLVVSNSQNSKRSPTATADRGGPGGTHPARRRGQRR